MKKARKLLVALLVLTFLLSTFNVGFAADNDDVSRTPAVDRAIALGILRGDDQGNLNLDKPITRAEALALIIRISGLEVSADLMKGATIFPDVNSDPSLQWATGYINLGVSNKIINGFPDGTFKGNNLVTYAEMAKMILYAMNYGVTVEGAPWPAGVMAKADDLKLFDKVAAAPNLPAIRGDVVQMIDNSLTVKHLVQKGYGSTEYYEEGKEDFLYKLRIDEIAGPDGEGLYVTGIARVNSRLDEDEIELEDGNIYTLKTPDVKPEEIFGKKVKIWVKRDDNKQYKDVFYVKVETAEKDNLFDAIKKVDNANSKVELSVANKKYAFPVDRNGNVTATIYINYKEAEFSELKAGMYGNFVLERGEVVFANLFEFDTNDIGLVSKVDDDYIEFIALEDAKEDEIDLEEYDEVVVYDKYFNVLDVDDIEKDTLVYFWVNKDDKQLFIVVAADVVEGEIDRVRDNKVRIDGKSYDKGDAAILSYDEGKKYETWDALNDVEDLTEEKVWALLGLDGKIAVIRGDAVETSGTIYGIVTYAKVEKDGVLSLFNKEGKVVDYKAEKRSDLSEIDKDKMNYYGKLRVDDGVKYAIASFKLNRDGEIAEGTLDTVTVTDESAPGEISLFKDAKKAYFTDDADNVYYVSEDTIIMAALKDGELDPSVISYDDFVAMEVDGDNEDNTAVVFGDPGKTAKLVVFLCDNFEGSKETYYFGVVTDDPWVGRKDITAQVHVAGEGKEEYKIKEAHYDNKYFVKGNLVAFSLNSKGEADNVVYAAVYAAVYSKGTRLVIDSNDLERDKVTVVNGIVKDVDGQYVELTDKKVYRIASDAVIYDYKFEDGKFKLDHSIRVSRISEDYYVVFILDNDSKEVKAAAVYYAKDLEKFNK
jgi:hypothetical protein